MRIPSAKRLTQAPSRAQSRKRLHEAARLAKVMLADGESAVITTLRLKILANGYVPCPNRDKRCLFKGWNALNPDAEEVKIWLNPRAGATRFPATGLLIVGTLTTIDNDLPIPDIADEIRLSQQQIAPQLLGALTRGRSDNSPKFMWFARRAAGTAPFTIKSCKWSVNPDDPDAPEFQVEIFASDRNREGKAIRQVGAHGAHTVDDETGILERLRGRARGGVALL
jgi:hypothetical protein